MSETVHPRWLSSLGAILAIVVPILAVLVWQGTSLKDNLRRDIDLTRADVAKIHAKIDMLDEKVDNLRVAVADRLARIENELGMLPASDSQSSAVSRQNAHSVAVVALPPPVARTPALAP